MFWLNLPLQNNPSIFNLYYGGKLSLLIGIQYLRRSIMLKRLAKRLIAKINI
jgi:hypothetical protein